MAADRRSGWSGIARLPTGALPVLRAPHTVSPHSGWRRPLRAAAIGVLLLSVFAPLFGERRPPLAFAVSDPDRRIADHNVDRFERTGRIDTTVLVTLSAGRCAGVDAPAGLV